MATTVQLDKTLQALEKRIKKLEKLLAQQAQESVPAPVAVDKFIGKLDDRLLQSLLFRLGPWTIGCSILESKPDVQGRVKACVSRARWKAILEELDTNTPRARDIESAKHGFAKAFEEMTGGKILSPKDYDKRLRRAAAEREEARNLAAKLKELD